MNGMPMVFARDVFVIGAASYVRTDYSAAVTLPHPPAFAAAIMRFSIMTFRRQSLVPSWLRPGACGSKLAKLQRYPVVATAIWNMALPARFKRRDDDRRTDELC